MAEPPAPLTFAATPRSPQTAAHLLRLRQWCDQLRSGCSCQARSPFWVCPHVVIVQINAHSKLAIYFLKFNIVFVILKYLL